MPGGPTLTGLAAFAGVKAVGYTAAGAVFKHYLAPGQPRPRVLAVGAVRAAIGVAAGLAYGAFFLFYAPRGWNMQAVPALWLFFSLLLPVRLFEWWLLLWIFFRRELARHRSWPYLAGGIASSYALDAIGIAFALVVPGSYWVC